MSSAAAWTILVMLLAMRGLFAAMEAAIQGVSDLRIKELAKAGSYRAQRVSRLKADPESTAAALRSGMVLSGFLAAALGVVETPATLDMSLARVFDSSNWLHWVTPLTSALLVAVLATVFDVTLRSMAVQKPEPVALALSRLGVWSVALFNPFVRGLMAVLNLVLTPFGTKVSFQAPAPPLEELEKQLIRQAQREELDQGA